jgi:thymidylate synthase ThyX
VSPRELYHISRLREDRHAQWDIMRISTKMLDLARRVAPLTFLLSCGKDAFSELRHQIYG